MNRYSGNTGRRERVPEPDRFPAPPPPPRGNTKPRSGAGRGGGMDLSGLLSRLSLNRLEQEDLLLMLVLYLLYRESGDRELLIALGAFLLL